MGALKSDISQLIGNPYMFTGRRLDPETFEATPDSMGLYYYRARMYHPQLGRFMQPDPIGYYDSMNLYQYCGNNPVNSIDPFGEEVFLLFQNSYAVPRWMGYFGETASKTATESLPGTIVPRAVPAPPMTIEQPSSIKDCPPKGNQTKGGVQRNARKHWKENIDRPDLSEANRQLIKDGKSPLVDDQWIKHHPEHQPYKGDKIEIHHKDGGPQEIELPKTPHRGKGFYRLNHPKQWPA